MNEEQSMWLRILEVAKRFDQKDPSVHHLRRTESRVHAVTGPESIGASPETGNVHEMTSNEGAEDVGENQNHDNRTSGNSGTNFMLGKLGTTNRINSAEYNSQFTSPNPFSLFVQ